LPRSTDRPRGSLTLHVGLRNLILQRDERVGKRGVPIRAALLAGLSLAFEPISSLLASASLLQLHVNVRHSLNGRDWHMTDIAKRCIIVVVLDANVQCCVSPCCDQLLSSSYSYMYIYMYMYMNIYTCMYTYTYTYTYIILHNASRSPLLYTNHYYFASNLLR